MMSLALLARLACFDIMLSPIDVLAILSALSLCIALRLRSAQWRRVVYPPGPRPTLLLGNVSDVPVTKEAETYAEMAKQFGPLLHLRVLNKHMIVINSLSVAEDLLERRGAIYSDRPQFTMLGELMGWAWAPTFMTYGPRWKAHRRIFQTRIGTSSLSSHLHLAQQYANVKLLNGLLRKPEEFMKHTHCSSAAGLLMMSYGIDIDKDSKYLTLNDAAVDSMVEAGVPGTYAVDWISSLKHVPSWMPVVGRFKRQALAWSELSRRVLEEPFAHARSAMAAGSVPTSWVSEQLSDPDNTAFEEELVKACAATNFAAGVDTVKSCVNAGILALVIHEKIQERAYAEIVAVVGRDRLPNADDRASLPFIEAFVREVYRFYPPVPLGMPHAVMEDDTYKGYLIPKGTTVLANIWAMMRDPGVFVDPQRFDPDRFLADGKLCGETVDPRGMLFGFGRRTCPGKLYGDSAVWLAIVSIIACFSVEPAPEGRPSGDMRSGLGSGPLPFECIFKTRSGMTANLIAEATARVAIV